MTSSPPQAPPAHSITLAIRFAAYERWGNINIQIIALCIYLSEFSRETEPIGYNYIYLPMPIPIYPGPIYLSIYLSLYLSI